MILQLPKEIIEAINIQRPVRTRLACEKHWYFFSIYLHHYISYAPAIFHDELFEITENEKVKNAVIVAFRGSGKSTLMTLSYPLWSIMGRQQKKFVLILGHTMQQARVYMKNIKEELETNDLLRADLGPFREENEWQAYSLVIPRYNARIICASYEQGIRGMRHRQFRPDLIIADDLESLESVKTLENRNKTYEWFTGEVIPCGDKNTKIIVIGNLLHEDSLIMRLKKKIQEGALDGVFREYPLLDGDGNVTWPAKYPTSADIEIEKHKIGNPVAWAREYLLIIMADEDRIVQPGWIQYYDVIPDTKRSDYRFTATAIDLASRKTETADFTAMLSARVFGQKENLRIYILPNPINERLSPYETLKKAEMLSYALGNGSPTKVFVENVAYQFALIDLLQNRNIPAEEFNVHSQDKRSRLSIAASLLQSGKVLWPRHGTEQVIEQLLNFGYQKHDDLADAFAILVHKILETKPRCMPEVFMVNLFGGDDN